jgi:hypothetical protein
MDFAVNERAQLWQKIKVLAPEENETTNRVSRVSNDRAGF